MSWCRKSRSRCTVSITMSRSSCRNASGIKGVCERTRASVSRLMSGFGSDCSAAALSSAASRSGSQYSAALAIASCTGTYPSAHHATNLTLFRDQAQISLGVPIRTAHFSIYAASRHLPLKGRVRGAGPIIVTLARSSTFATRAPHLTTRRGSQSRR